MSQTAAQAPVDLRGQIKENCKVVFPNVDPSNIVIISGCGHEVAYGKPSRFLLVIDKNQFNNNPSSGVLASAVLKGTDRYNVQSGAHELRNLEEKLLCEMESLVYRKWIKIEATAAEEVGTDVEDMQDQELCWKLFSA